MTTHNDSKLAALQRELDDAALHQVALTNKERQVRKEMEAEIARIKSNADRELMQIHREQDGYARQADTTRRGIERRIKELDDEVKRAVSKH